MGKCLWIQPGTPAPTPSVTPSPTPAPTPVSPGPCKSWCSADPAEWTKKCTWSSCGGCEACVRVPTPSPTPSPNACAQFCGRTNLTARGEQCGARGSDSSSCLQSFISIGPFAMTCIWTDCGCFADETTVSECPSLTSLCTEN